MSEKSLLEQWRAAAYNRELSRISWKNSGRLLSDRKRNI